MLQGNFIGKINNVKDLPQIEYIGSTYADTNTASATVNVSLPAGTRKEDLMILSTVLENSAAGQPTAPTGFTLASRRNGSFVNSSCTHVTWTGTGQDTGTVDVDITGFGGGAAFVLSTFRNATATFGSFQDVTNSANAVSTLTLITLDSNEGYYAAAQFDGSTQNPGNWNSDALFWDSSDNFILTASIAGRGGQANFRKAGDIPKSSLDLSSPDATVGGLFSVYTLSRDSGGRRDGIFDLDDIYLT